MQMPSVVHPRNIDVGGVVFQVVSYSPLTDQQAKNVVRYYLTTHKVRKKDKGKLIQVITMLDQESTGLFG
jgi:hypothetical protein